MHDYISVYLLEILVFTFHLLTSRYDILSFKNILNNKENNKGEIKIPKMINIMIKHGIHHSFTIIIW